MPEEVFLPVVNDTIENDISRLYRPPVVPSREDYVAPKPIRAAIDAVIAAIAVIEKRGENTEKGYTFVRSDDIVAAVGQACHTAKLLVTQHPVGVFQDPSKNMVVGWQFVFQMVDTDEIWIYPGTWLGVADDWDHYGNSDPVLNDKWFNMAATAAEKYFYMKVFKIETKESVKADPDAGRSTKEGAARTATPKGTTDTAALRETYRHIVSLIDDSTSMDQLTAITGRDDYKTLLAHSENTKKELEGRIAKHEEEITGGTR